ncbi:MAG: ABC transporter ATP-binding protein [Infirmifilum sp.]|jgi:branched-chain amino acid transport system ATP-binding protein/urea transport system ATP-binding protein
MNSLILQLRNLYAYYGKAQVLHGISLEVEKEDFLVILGRNGVGKTTLLKAIMNIEVLKKGEIIYKSINITNLKTYQIAKTGIFYIPDDTGLFQGMTVLENLMLTAGKRDIDLQPLYDIYPKLRELLNRKADQLSGGERKITTVLRSLLTNADLLLIDELTEGVAPIMVTRLYEMLKELRNRGKTIVAVEPGTKLNIVLNYATKIAVMDMGKIVYINDVDQAKNEKDKITRYIFI